MLIYGLIILGSLFRIVSHVSGFEIFPPNFAPIGAMAFFGGYHLPPRQSLFLLLASMLVSDLIVGFYSPLVMASVYGSFVLINLLGRRLGQQKRFIATASGVLFSSLLFFLITNFAVWAAGYYGRSLEGLLESYIAGIPFFKFTLLGDIFFNSVFFTTYYLANHFYAAKRLLLAKD